MAYEAFWVGMMAQSVATWFYGALHWDIGPSIEGMVESGY